MPIYSIVWRSMSRTSGACLVLLSIFLVGCGGGSGSATNSTSQTANSLTAAQRSVVATYEDQRKKAESEIAEIESANALQLTSDGKMTLKPATSRAAVISPDAEKFAIEALTGLNAQVAAGKVYITNDLQVHPVVTDTTRGNLQGFQQWHWWGVTWALNATNSNKLASVLGYGGSIVGAGLGIEGGPGGAMIGAALGGFPGFVVSWYNSPGQGIYINVTWSLSIWLASQH